MDEVIHDLPADSPMNRGWRKQRPVAQLIVMILFVIAFSLGSYAVWDFIFTQYDGQCLGPVCITGPP